MNVFLLTKRCLAPLFLSALVLSCSNEHFNLRSKFNNEPSNTYIRLGITNFPESKLWGNYFLLNGIKGEVSLSNVMTFDSKDGKFKRSLIEPFNIIVVAYLENPDDKDIFFTNITGILRFSNGLEIKPNLILQSDNNLLCRRAAFNNVVTLTSKIKVVSANANRRTCLLFEYPEFINPEREFSLDVANVNNESNISKLFFSFRPMVNRETTH